MITGYYTWRELAIFCLTILLVLLTLSIMPCQRKAVKISVRLGFAGRHLQSEYVGGQWQHSHDNVYIAFENLINSLCDHFMLKLSHNA